MGWKWMAKACLVLLLIQTLNASAGAVGTSARSAILVDADSGRVLYEQNADERMLIASITKIMTAVVALENGKTTDTYTVTDEDMAEGSSMYLAVGETLTLEELLYGLMLSSGNDAALAVAHCVSGTVEDFVAEMNAKAEELGMRNTSFANPNGLDHENHYSTARDMAVLTAYALQNAAFARIVSTKSITIGTRTLTNHNKLLSQYEGCIGVKTGYTKAAGRTLVSAAWRAGQTLVAVTLSDGNDWQDHASLLDYGFAAYPDTEVLSAGEAVCAIPVKGATTAAVNLAAGASLWYPLASGEAVSFTVDAPSAVTAPLPAGTVVGSVTASLDGAVIGEVPLVTGAALTMDLSAQRSTQS